MKKTSVVFLFFAIGYASEVIGQSLNNLNVDSRQMTLSGFASGGTFAQMLLFAYPQLWDGIALYSHTYYRCGLPNGKVDDYDRLCTALFNTTEDKIYNSDNVHNDIKDYESKNLIGSTSLLKDKKLYGYTPLRSILFTPVMSTNIMKVMEKYIPNPKNIRMRIQDAPLVMPTNNYGPPCSGDDVGMEHFNIGNCGFSGAFEGLNFLLGNKVINEPLPSMKINLQPLQEFDQEEFVKGIENHQLDTKGFFYVPTACQINRCIVHFFFHNCFVGREFSGTKFIQHSGFLEVAELNNIIMIFPQALTSLPENDAGCWDTFGISGPLYATNKGAQMIVMKRIIDRVRENDRPVPVATTSL